MNGLEVLTVTVRAEIAERESQDKHLGFVFLEKKSYNLQKMHALGNQHHTRKGKEERRNE